MSEKTERKTRGKHPASSMIDTQQFSERAKLLEKRANRALRKMHKTLEEAAK